MVKVVSWSRPLPGQIGFMGLEVKMEHRQKRIGEILIAVGVLAWAPYFLMKLAGAEAEMEPFLVVHLSGVIPGFILRRYDWIRRLLRRPRKT
ncbi:MAG: hypothetical protein D6775_06555 [Caldilineae bacterium]|nr:MAG: hypothetical protein D6775_06555 [Caldilineae bacterium]